MSAPEVSPWRSAVEESAWECAAEESVLESAPEEFPPLAGVRVFERPSQLPASDLEFFLVELSQRWVRLEWEA